jgi:hypothetical protein
MRTIAFLLGLVLIAIATADREIGREHTGRI